MSGWNAALCNVCWEALEGDRVPVRVIENRFGPVIDYPVEVCSNCGRLNRSGIYRRVPPRDQLFYTPTDEEKQGRGMNPVTQAEISNRVTYHEVSEQGLTRIRDMRHQAEVWMNAVRIEVPEGREQSLALTKIEEALMWCNAGIARHASMQAES